MSRWRRRACGFWLSGHYDWVLERNRQAHQAAFFERQVTNCCPISGKLKVIHGLPTIFTSSPYLCEGFNMGNRVSYLLRRYGATSMESSSNSSFFYQGRSLVSMMQGNQLRSVFRTPDMPLAEQRVDGGEAYHLFSTDGKASVLSVQETDKGEQHAYSVYGHDPKLPSTLTLLGFNGEAFTLVSGCYALGNGYRSFNPTLMRFTSPDRLSPFGKGGVNAYCYCSCDPVNNVDPSGRMMRRISPVLIPKPVSIIIPKSVITINSINEPDIFSKVISYLDLRSAAALSRVNKHVYSMTRAAFSKMEVSLSDPEKLLAASQKGTVGPGVGQSYELLVKRPDIKLPPQSKHDGAREQLIRDIDAARKFRAAQRSRLSSFDSSSGSDSEDELQRISQGIRKAMNGPQL